MVSEDSLDVHKPVSIQDLAAAGILELVLFCQKPTEAHPIGSLDPCDHL
jgi:hypothetical protein